MLYIGNATRQSLEFQYRIAREAPVRTQPIPPGAQIRISGELTPAQVDYVVSKHAKYGVVGVDEIDRSRGFHGTCYSIGKPISGMKLTLLMDRNFGALVTQGREIREQTAVAQNNMLETALLENGRPEKLTGMDLTIQQENQDGNNSVAQFSEGFRVRRDGDVPPATARRNGKRRAA